MKLSNNTYTLPIDFEMAFTLASSDEWSSYSLYGNKLLFNGVESQNVTFLNERDEKLLKHSISHIKFFDKECMQITAHCLGNEEFSSQIIKGDKCSVSSKKQMSKIMKELIHQCSKTGRQIRHIEVSHTHLGRQYIEVTSDRVTKIKTHGLSKRDFQCIRELKQFIDYPIKLRAVTQEHMVYEKMIA